MIYKFEAETRLLRWGESSAAGRTITLEIPPDDAPHPFRGFPVGHAHGQRFRMAFVAIDDDETEMPDPVADVKLRSPDSPPQDHANSGSSHAPAGGVNSRSILARERYRNSSAAQQATARACLLPTDKEFQDWAGCTDELAAVDFIRRTIGGSRSMIDQVYEFYERYLTLETRYLIDTGKMAAPR